MRIFLVFILVLLLIPTVSFAVPQLLSVQGKMTDVFGNNLTGSYNFVFRIYTQGTGGTPIWTEYWNTTNQQVTLGYSGYFSVLLGSHNPLTLPFDQQYWLEVQVASDVLSPRFKMGSSPYTYRANITENLAPGTKAAGTLNMNSYDISGASNVYSGVFYESGTALSSKYALQSTSIIAGSGLTGGGTLTADRTLSLNYGTNFLGFGNLTNYPAGCGAGEYVSAVGDTLTCSVPTVPSGGGWVDEGPYIRLATLTDKIILGANATPSQALDVVGNINATGYVYGITGLCIGGDCRTSWPGGAGAATPWDNSSAQVFVRSGFPLVVNISDLLFVNSTSGSVGIGTANPAYKLDVGGSIRGTQMDVIGTLYSSSTTNLAVSSGLVGIGTATPQNKLNVIGDINATGNVYGTNALCIASDCRSSWPGAGTTPPWDNSTTQLFVRSGYPNYINASNTLFVNGSSGTVGIGTTNPQGKLNVIGDINATGNIYGTLGANTVASSSIQSGAISADKIAANAVNTTHILDGTINAADIANGVITAGKLVSDLALGWQNLTTYPATCPAGQAIQALGDTLTCVDLNSTSAGNVSGAGNANYIAKFTGTGTIGNSVMYDNGNVGIGTANPQGKLEVIGTLNATNIVLRTNCVDGQVLKWSGGVGTCGTDSGVGSEADTLQTVTSRGATTIDAVTIDSDANGVTNISGNFTAAGTLSVNSGKVDVIGAINATGNLYEGGTLLSSKYALQSTSISAGSGLAGGGDLSASRTLSIAQGGVTNTMIAANSVNKTQISGTLDSSVVGNIDAANITTGTIASARVSGTYSGVTGLGTQTQNLNMGGNNLTNYNYIAANDSARLGGQATSYYLNTSTQFGGNITGTYNNLDLAPNSVDSSKIADNTIDLADVAFYYAASSSKGGPASDLSCANCVGLGAETTGEYVYNVTPGTGIAISGGTGEGSTPTINIDTSVVPRKNQQETISEDWTFQKNIFVGGNITYVNSQTLNVNGSIVPPLDNWFNVGAPNNRWAKIYGVNIYQSGNLVLDNTTSFSGEVSGTFDSLQIGVGAVGVAKIASGAVTNIKIAANAVNTTQIIDGTIQSSDIANGAITNTKIAADAVNTTQIVDGTIAAADIANGVITAGKLVSDLGLGWTNLTTYPTACGTGKAVQAIGDTLTCVDLNSTSGNISGAGTPNYVAKFVAAGQVGNSIIYDDGTNVGIGTSSPAALLQLQKSSNPVIFMNNTGFMQNPAAIYPTNDAGTRELEIYSGRDATGQLDLNIKTGDTAVGSASRLFINGTSGNIGIGTIVPGATLEVNGGVRLNTTASKPTCNAMQRGTFWLEQSAGGLDDYMYACMRNSAGGYNWILVARGG